VELARTRAQIFASHPPGAQRLRRRQAPDGARAIHRAVDTVDVAPSLRGAFDVAVGLAATSVVSVVHHQRVNPAGRSPHVDHMRTTSIPSGYRSFTNHLHIRRQFRRPNRRRPDDESWRARPTPDGASRRTRGGDWRARIVVMHPRPRRSVATRLARG
jgi:hypothetical protein